MFSQQIRFENLIIEGRGEYATHPRLKRELRISKWMRNISTLRGCEHTECRISWRHAGKIMNLALNRGFMTSVYRCLRVIKRATFWDAKLATPIWSRIQKFVKPIYHDSAWWIQQHLESPAPAIMNRWVWTFMRISKYEAGQSFRWHSDSVYGTSDDNLGFQTIVVSERRFSRRWACFRVWEDVEDATDSQLYLDWICPSSSTTHKNIRGIWFTKVGKK
jgi:hypothetical protein